MTKDLKKNKELIQKLKDMGAKDYCSFMVYPKSRDSNVKGKARVELEKDYIQNDLFKDINKDNGLMFVGLNAANRDNDDFNDFKMMHDKNGTDYRTLRRIESAKKENRDLILGSFICDILSNVVSTHLISLNGITKNLDQNLPQFNPIENPIDIPKCLSKKNNKEGKLETFSFRQIYRLSFDKLEKINKHVKREKKKAKIKKGLIQKRTRYFENIKKDFEHSKKDEAIRNELKQSRSKLFKNISYINELNERLKIEKRKASIDLYNHILYYDIPAFVTFVKIIKPKVLICFGNEATNLAQVIVDKCLPEMHLKVKYTEHFASLGINKKGNNTFAQKGKELDDLIDSIKKELNLKVEGTVLKEK